MQSYNVTGYNELQSLTRLTKYEIYETAVSIGIKVHYNTFSKWMYDGSIPPGHLLALCNYFRYPISNFSKTKGADGNGRTYRLFAKEEWENLYLCTSRISDYATKVGHKRRKDAIKQIGCSDGYYDSLRKYPDVSLPDKLTFTDLLAYTNNVKMYAGDVIIDHNELFPLEKDIRPYYDYPARSAHYDMYPVTEMKYASDRLLDSASFFTQYIQHKHLEGDEKIIAMKVRSLNEIASSIFGITNENLRLEEELNEARHELDTLRSAVKELKATIQKLTSGQKNEKEEKGG